MLPFRLAPMPPWWPRRAASASGEDVTASTPSSATPPAAAAPVADDPALPPEARAGRSNLMQLVQLRWLAVGGQLGTVLAVHFGLGLRLPILAMLSLLASLAMFNLASWLRAGTARHVGQPELFLGLVMDLVVLTGLLALSGGVNNPFVFVYLPQLAVGALLLRSGYAWTLVFGACVAIMLLAQWHVPLRWPDAPEPQRLSLHYLGGLLLCFALCASLLVLAIARFGRNLRLRDARLAALRQRAAEEDHIVRMGLLASGAAHELGTPLATLSVILGDWAHMAPFAGEPELRDDIEQMQAQVQRCKAIITGILMSAGDSRGEAPQATTLREFLQALAVDWRERRAQAGFAAELGPLPATPIIADTGLRQMVTNVLDNALEAMQAAGTAPPAMPRLLAECDGERLCLRVLDRGAGFSDEMLASFGRPYHSSKGRPGGGLGLFLSVNVARKLGGNVSARNREAGGAEVQIDLPLAALSLPAAPAFPHEAPTA
jgi:two-component system sensor histidine kinase RegB